MRSTFQFPRPLLKMAPTRRSCTCFLGAPYTEPWEKTGLVVPVQHPRQSRRSELLRRERRCQPTEIFFESERDGIVNDNGTIAHGNGDVDGATPPYVVGRNR